MTDTIINLAGWISIILPAIAIIVAFLLSFISRKLTSIWASLSTFSECFIVIYLMVFIKTPFDIKIPFLDLPLIFNFHPIGLFVAFIPAFLGFLSMVFSYSYQKNMVTLYYTSSLIFISTMIFLVLSGNMLWVFIFMEGATISSAILVSSGKRPEAKEATIKYLVITIFTSAFTIIGMFTIKNITGTLVLNEIDWNQTTSLLEMKFAIGLIFIGLSTKAAAFPFYFWLPDAHSEAPTPTSVLLSGGKIKVATYAVFIVIYKLIDSLTVSLSSGGLFDLGFILMFIGALTMILGNIMALGQNDLKRMLAYCSISQIGYVLIGFSLGTALGIAAALFHMLTHSISKGLLFFGAGSIEYSTGTRDIDKLGSIASQMPFTTISMIVGSLSISGIPPFGGYTSKRLLYEAFIEGNHPELAIIGIFVSALTLLLFLKLLSSVFFGLNPYLDLPPFDEIKESPKTMNFPMIIMALGCLIVGIIPDFLINTFISPGIGIFLPGEEFIISAWPNILIQTTSSEVYSPFSATILIFIGLFFGLLLYRFSGRKPTIKGTPDYDTISKSPSGNLPFTGGFYKAPYLSLGEIYVPSTPFEYATSSILNFFRQFHTGRLTSYLWYISAGAIMIIGIIVIFV